MFNILKQKTKELPVSNYNSFGNKTTKEIVEEIHETFYSEVDRLLADAKILKPLETDKQDLIDKSTRLKSLGFVNTSDVYKSEEEIKRLRSLELENQIKNDLHEAINYFSFKYPQYKFITEQSVRKICEKYNLVYSEVSNYISDVPDINLEHIENFKIEEFDECFQKEIQFIGLSLGNNKDVKYISFETFKKETAPFTFDPKEEAFDVHIRMQMQQRKSMSRYFSQQYLKSPLEICAPIKDFKKDLMELKDFKLSKIEIPDPIVLKPVFFKGKKHYLIVTAWGDEASDELVLNQNHN